MRLASAARLMSGELNRVFSRDTIGVVHKEALSRGTNNLGDMR